MPSRSALVVRTQLNPYEEARAVAAMLASGLTEDGAAQALGWPKARVTARMRLLELPDVAQEMVGAGAIALSSVEQLRAIGRVSAPLLDALIAYLADGNQFAAERLSREPGWVLDAALRESDSKVFAEHLTRVDAGDVTALKLGKKTEGLYERAVALARQLDRYAYGADVRFADVEVDQARAAGVAIEFERGTPLIVDRSLYRELVKQAVARTVTELEARVAERATEQQADRAARGQLPVDPAAQAHRDEQRAVRAIAERAHAVNLDIGAGLLTGLATVDPSDMNVARFFALCGYPHRTNYADGVTMPRGQPRGRNGKVWARPAGPRLPSRYWREMQRQVIVEHRNCFHLVMEPTMARCRAIMDNSGCLLRPVASRRQGWCHRRTLPPRSRALVLGT